MPSNTEEYKYNYGPEKRGKDVGNNQTERKVLHSSMRKQG